MLELARAFSGAVAAMQGHAGPLALNSSAYIRPDGQSLDLAAAFAVHLAGYLFGQQGRLCRCCLQADLSTWYAFVLRYRTA